MLTQVVANRIPIKEVLYTESIRDAVVVLKDGTSRDDLESLQPDLQLMMSELKTDLLNGMIVTCKGMSLCMSKDILSFFVGFVDVLHIRIVCMCIDCT